MITVLETVGPFLTKSYKSDGSTEAYGDAASFKVKEVEAESLKDMRDLLGKLHKNPKRCLIRGKFIGKDKAQPGKVAGTFVRNNGNFEDQPLHWFMLDIDGYRPGFANPVHETEQAVMDFLLEKLPPVFQTASFYWHLSSSAGMPGKEGILKCHVHFWSRTAYTTAEMYAWAKGYPSIDKAVYRRVQIHYCADPIFEEGRTDPVPVRAGWHQGETDDVDLQIGQDTLAQAREQGAGQGGNDMKLVDPSEKEGLIGLFNRVYSAEDVLLTHLDEFEQISERRYTWHNGGGTPEGVWVHDDGMHVGSSHNTWPIDGIANLWDLVRVFKFGHLDHSEDDFVQEDIDSRGVGHRPSDYAMYAYAEGLPEIREANREAKASDLRRLQAMLQAAEDTYDLENVVAPAIRESKLGVADRAIITDQLANQLRILGGARVPIAQVRQMTAPPRGQAVAADAPAFVSEWVWINELDRFANVTTKETVSLTSFNAMFGRLMGAYSDENGTVPKASDMALNVWDMPFFSRAEYYPRAKDGDFFLRDGLRIFNTYRLDLVPKPKSELSPKGIQAVKILNTHLEMLVPCAKDRRNFMDFLAYCVQKPGHKVRWSPLLKGVEGDGKSAFVMLLGSLMGSANVRVLDSATLENSTFSGWSVGTCVTGIEEVKMHGHNRYDIYNKLKPYLSNTVIEVHPKGRDPYNAPNITNYILFSNFDDAVPITDNDRRVMFLRSPFNRKEELFAKVKEITGLSSEDYFHELFDVAIGEQSANLLRYFLDYEISESFNPNGRAPETAARGIAVEVSKSDAENAFAEVLDQEAFGIYPGLVAVAAVKEALKHRFEQNVSDSRISGFLVGLGYTSLGQHRFGAGRRYSFYGKDIPEEASVRELAERLEAERQAKEVEGDFRD